MKKVLVIDDDRFVKSFVEKFASDVEVEQMFRIPDDRSTLPSYDAIVVDGQGIGNEEFKNGLEFLKTYNKPEGQSVVYYSGLGVYDPEDKKILERRGVAVVTKGSNPEKLVLAIRFSKMKAVETAKEENAEKAEKAEKVEKTKKAKRGKHANRRHKRRR